MNAGRFARLAVVAPIAAAFAAAIGVGVLDAGAAAPVAAPRREAVGTSALVRDGVVRPDAVRRVRRLGVWGGPITTPSGPVRTFFSDAIPADPAVAQGWATFLAGLQHGAELQTVTLYVLTRDELDVACSEDAVACYDRSAGTIFSPSTDDEIDGTTHEDALVHEYGHHVANNRLNTPWPSSDWGPKRWSTATGICQRAAAGTAFPAGGPVNYRLLPSEAFAEAYRVLHANGTRITRSWNIVDPSFFPDAPALEAIAADVKTPWTQPRTAARTGAFRARGPSWVYTSVATPLDGSLTVDLRLPAGVAYDLSLFDAAGRPLAQGRSVGKARRTVAFTICGQRSVRVGVFRRSGPPRTFYLDVTAP
jgi:hypothetical protein